MRWSQFFLPTLREDPKDSEAVSHKLMLRAGLIRRLGSGAYSYLPFGLRALQRATAIVREEMNRSGGQEVLLPALHPAELWKTTGRYAVMGDVLIKFKDRTGKELVLGPTHEEVITDLAKEIRSYQQLPILLYQIQTKFRDEPRPRSGVIRSKEFIMKDAYSFHTDWEDLGRTYQVMYDAYLRIFARSGLRVLACEADSGAMGGDVSHEFMAPADSGEDRVVQCQQCGYAANLEAAKAAPLSPSPAEMAGGMRAVETPGQHTVEEVSSFLKVKPEKLIKTLIYENGADIIAVLVRGDHEVNEAKLARLLKSTQLRLASATTIQRVTGAPVGFAGPVGLKGARLVADEAVQGMVNAVTGANRDQAHLINVNPGRDFQAETLADLRFATELDRCAKCGGAFRFVQAIESGHVFKLGTKYSESLKALFQDQAGQLKPMIMGCYGIGVNRLLAAAIEQNHDEQGIRWPVALAPFDVVLVQMEADSAEQGKVAEELYQQLQSGGLSVLFDDRRHSPGSKLKDADLIGVPVQIIVGKTWQTQQQLEVRSRLTKEKLLVPPPAVPEAAEKLLDKPATLS